MLSSVCTAETALKKWEKEHESVNEMGSQNSAAVASLVRLVINFFLWQVHNGIQRNGWALDFNCYLRNV